MDGFNPFEELDKLRALQKRQQHETMMDLHAFKNLKRSKSGQRVLALMKRVVDFDGPVFRTNPVSGSVDVNGALIRDGFRGAIDFIERNAALADSSRIGKDVDA